MLWATFLGQKVIEFGEITQNKGHYAVQGHSRSPIFALNESSYRTSYYLLSYAVSEYIAFDRSKSIYLATHLAFSPLDGRVLYTMSS